MKSFPKRHLLIAATGLAAVAVAARADLPDWVRHLESGTPLEAVFFREVPLPSGPVMARRPPSETRTALDAQIAANSNDATLYALRARESERSLAIEAAEADWRRFAERTPDKHRGQMALADFHARRVQAEQELTALIAAGAAPDHASERLTPAAQRRSWQAYERGLRVIADHLLPAPRIAALYEAWIDRFPAERSVPQRYFAHLIDSGRLDEAESTLDFYRGSFPGDTAFSILGEARLLRARDGDEAAIAFWDAAFDPLWPQSLINGYFALLDDAGVLRATADRIRQRAATQPGELLPAAWQFHYQQRRNDRTAAMAALSGYERSKGRAAPWQPAELRAVGHLYRGTLAYNDAARAFTALYSHPQSGAGQREEALSSLIRLLLNAADRPIHLGMGDLSLYKDIATMDRHPGVLNGIFSLLFNRAYPEYEYETAERQSVGYFHRGQAAELLARFESEFPGSDYRAGLRAAMLQAYAVHGEDERLVDHGRRFLTEFPASREYTNVALAVAEAHARLGAQDAEFATYQALLDKLANASERMPLANPRPAVRQGGAAPAPRSPDYARVLDRYVARLTASGQPEAAARVYAEQIAANPNDPGLYERFADSLQSYGFQNRVEQVYQQAIARFDEPDWHHKLARWYLRQKRQADVFRHSQGLVESFDGTDLEPYFQQIIYTSSVGPQFYLQLNQAAHARFPRNLAFVRNLLRAYSTKGTANATAHRDLLRRYWFYGDDLRAQFLADLSRRGVLADEANALQQAAGGASADAQTVAVDNPAMVHLWAEATAWRCRFEETADAWEALADVYVADDITARAASIHRSLAWYDRAHTQKAFAIQQRRAEAQPASTARLIVAGDTAADQGFIDDLATPLWQRVPAVKPGRQEGYLEAATVFWDYFRFDEALRQLDAGRDRLERPALFAYEAGAIYENQRDDEAAVREYLQGALAEDGYSMARSRLLRLARRSAHRERIDQATRSLVAGRAPKPAALSLRVDVLNATERRDEIEPFLADLAARADTFELLDFVEQNARNYRYQAVEARILDRRIALSQDPVRVRRLRIDKVRLLEQQGDDAAAERTIEALYRDDARILGVVRSAIDFHWRNKNYDRALAILGEAEMAAYADLGQRFRFEAASKATEAGKYVQARGLLEPLLAAKPFDARLLAAMADTYGKAGDDEGLRAFYETTIEAVVSSDLSTAQKRERVAGLRRGLIPALTRLGDHTAATDQYIELLNRFPLDDALIEEAAYYAVDHGQGERIEGHFRRTTEQSPRDYRYHRLIARLYEHFEQYEPAIAAYAKAAEVRPDRLDLFTERARLEERLLRFEAALSTYQAIHERTYEDPAWMEKIGEMHARLGRRPEAAAAIRSAYIDGRPERAENYAAAGEALERLGLLEEAFVDFEHASTLASEDIFRFGRYDTIARGYARLGTRLRNTERVYLRLKQRWLANPDNSRLYRFGQAMRAMGAAAAEYYTPEEKAAFASRLDQEYANQPLLLNPALIPLAQSAGFAGREAAWRAAEMLRVPLGSNSHRRRLIQLQSQRNQYAELGSQLEALWRAYPARNERDGILREAADAYRTAGDDSAELRALSTLAQNRALSGTWEERYFELLLASDPARLAAIGTPRSTEFVIARGDVTLAREAVRAFGEAHDVERVWYSAYDALTGLHFGAGDRDIRRAFGVALGGGTVGERLGSPVNRATRLAGEDWYYYGGRFAEFLTLTGDQAAVDYWPAELESRPGRASAYRQLGDMLRDHGRLDEATAEYRRSLALNPQDTVALARQADIAQRGGRRSEAIAMWRQALEATTAGIRGRRVSEALWTDTPAWLTTLADTGLRAELATPIRDLVAAYAKSYGAYRGEKLYAAYAKDDQSAADLLSLAGDTNDPLYYLRSLLDAAWLPNNLRGQAIESGVGRARAKWESAPEDSRYYQREQLDEWRHTWIEHLSSAERHSELLAFVDGEQPPVGDYREPSVESFYLASSAVVGRLEDVLAGYATGRRVAPSPREFQNAAQALRIAGRDAEARTLLAHHYQRRIDLRDLSAVNFLGLAEVRIEEGQTAAALRLVERMTLLADEPFGALRTAGEFLLSHGQATQASGYLDRYRQAVPWDAAGEAAYWSAASGGDRIQALTTTASSAEAPYAVRAAAAEALGEAANADILGSAELAWLANPNRDPAGLPQTAFATRAHRAAFRDGNSLTSGLMALAAAPQDNSLRLQLIEAAAAADQPQTAIGLAAAAPTINQNRYAYALSQFDSVYAVSPDPPYVDEYLARTLFAGTRLDDSGRAELAGTLANAFAVQSRSQTAYVLAVTAQGLAPPGELRVRLAEQANELAESMAARAADASSRPAIANHLDQPRVVRPRTIAGGAR